MIPNVQNQGGGILTELFRGALSILQKILVTHRSEKF